MIKIKKQVYILLLIAIIVILIGMYFWRLKNADECTKVEKYDIWSDSCYFECDSEEECSALSKKVENELNQTFEDSQFVKPTQKPIAPKQNNSVDGLYTNEATGTETNGTTYTVMPDSTLTPEPTREHQELWNLFKRIIGKEKVKKYFVSFEVFNDENNSTAASVWRTTNNASTWHMNMNEAYIDNRKDLVHTLVHEYAHVLTLSGDQVEQIEGACPYIVLAEGCTKDTSYIYRFHQDFWQMYGDEIPSNDGQEQDEVMSFYDSQPNNFVSEYAATNLTEDMAESFAYYVLRPLPQDTTTQKNAKVLFYKQYPEFDKMRNTLRAAIGENLLTASRYYKKP